jgi:hypothetical protein
MTGPDLLAAGARILRRAGPFNRPSTRADGNRVNLKRAGWLLLIGGGIAALIALARRGKLVALPRKPVISLPDTSYAERRSLPDREALEALATGSGEKVGVDLERLKELESGGFEPLIEYLTYIQVKRGDQESLVFVRRRDLDAMAALASTDKEQFVDEFQKLGVLLSMN